MKYRFFAVILLVFLVAISSQAQTKISGTHQCKVDSQQSMDIGDKPGHAFSISKTSCTWSKPMEIEGTKTTAGSSMITGEARGTRVNLSGYHTSTMDNGDTFWVHFQGTDTMKDGKPVSSKGTWSFVSGTGKLKGIHGKGTYEGTPNADGTITYEVEGEYTMPAAKPESRPAKKM